MTLKMVRGRDNFKNNGFEVGETDPRKAAAISFCN
jgi:hypothetical protein